MTICTRSFRDEPRESPRPEAGQTRIRRLFAIGNSAAIMTPVLSFIMAAKCLMLDVDGMICSGLAGCRKNDFQVFTFAELAAGYRPDELHLADDTLPNTDAAQASGWSA